MILNGYQFGAEKIQFDEIGLKIDSENSYDVVIIKSDSTTFDNENKDKNIQSSNILINYLDSSTHINEINDISIKLEINSDKFNTNQEGWFHHYFIQYMNEIKGIEYYSSHFNPKLIITKELLGFHSQSPDKLEKIDDKTKIIALFTDIGEYIMHQFHSQFSEISNLKIIFCLGKDLSSNPLTVDIIDKLLSKKEQIVNYIKRGKKEKKNEFFYSFQINSYRDPFSPIIITVNHHDPAGYLLYYNFDEDGMENELKEKYGIKKHPISILNDYISELSYGKIPEIILLPEIESSNSIPNVKEDTIKETEIKIEDIKNMLEKEITTPLHFKDLRLFLPGSSNFEIILKNAKLTAGSIIIKKKNE